MLHCDLKLKLRMFVWWYDREFKEKNKVDKVVVLWTANTERYSNVIAGLNDTMENLLAALDRNEAEISPSTLYAIACVMENVPFINGSPQNTFVPGFLFLPLPHLSDKYWIQREL